MKSITEFSKKQLINMDLKELKFLYDEYKGIVLKNKGDAKRGEIISEQDYKFNRKLETAFNNIELEINKRKSINSKKVKTQKRIREIITY